MRLLALLDAIDEAVLVVDHAGAVIKANQPFRDLVGDPDGIEVRDGTGSGDGHLDPRLRASREAFEARVTSNDREFAVFGRPLHGVDGGYGALIFRPVRK